MAPDARTPAWADDAVAATVAVLQPLADPVRAAPMAAYMRDQFPFLGVGTPIRTAALRRAWHDLPSPSAGDLAAAVTALWVLPHREYQYAACDLLQRFGRRPGPYEDASLLGPPGVGAAGVIHRLITSRSWWDTVDALRKVAVGPLVAAHPHLGTVLRTWIEADDRWLVRSALIHQLGYGERTDADLLFTFCARRAADQEFFVAKAVGWSLRTYARVDPDAVRAFVEGHPELTRLARREALKHVRADRSRPLFVISAIPVTDEEG